MQSATADKMDSRLRTESAPKAPAQRKLSLSDAFSAEQHRMSRKRSLATTEDEDPQRRKRFKCDQVSLEEPQVLNNRLEHENTQHTDVGRDQQGQACHRTTSRPICHESTTNQNSRQPDIHTEHVSASCRQREVDEVPKSTLRDRVQYWKNAAIRIKAAHDQARKETCQMAHRLKEHETQLASAKSEQDGLKEQLKKMSEENKSLQAKLERFETQDSNSKRQQNGQNQSTEPQPVAVPEMPGEVPQPPVPLHEEFRKPQGISKKKKKTAARHTAKIPQKDERWSVPDVKCHLLDKHLPKVFIAAKHCSMKGEREQQNVPHSEEPLQEAFEDLWKSVEEAASKIHEKLGVQLESNASLAANPNEALARLYERIRKPEGGADGDNSEASETGPTVVNFANGFTSRRMLQALLGTFITFEIWSSAPSWPAFSEWVWQNKDLLGRFEKSLGVTTCKCHCNNGDKHC